MADAKKEFVFTWMIENFSYCLQKRKVFKSPKFTLCDKSEWCLWLYPRDEDEKSMDYISCYLNREDEDSDEISLGFTFELLNGEGLVLKSRTIEQFRFVRQDCESPDVELLENLHEIRRNEYLPNDTLTVRCRIWKVDGSFPEGGQCLAQTHFKTEKLAFLWCIKNVSALSSTSQRTVVIKTASNPGRKISFNLFKDDLNKDLIRIQMAVDYDVFKERQVLLCEFNLLDRCKKKVANIKKNYVPRLMGRKWEIAFEFEKLPLDRALYLQNDTLNIQCHVVVSDEDSVDYVHEFEEQNQQDMISIPGVIKREIESSVPNDLKHDLLMMYQDGTLSDVTLQTETESFPAHKSVLCARSPVFYKMFTVDMKEKTTNNVQIDDLDADTVRLFLMYIYNDSVENLDLESAKKLYFAGDKYQVLNLRKMCAKLIMAELSKKNVYEILLLADWHEDEIFKDSVMEFIVDHIEEIIKMEEWISFMKSNVHLAAEIMYKKLNAD